jgi:hypothetical protein
MNLKGNLKINKYNNWVAMKTKKKREITTTVSIRATASEIKQIELIKKERRINSYSHTLRVLIAEEAEKLQHRV